MLSANLWIPAFAGMTVAESGNDGGREREWRDETGASAIFAIFPVGYRHGGGGRGIMLFAKRIRARRRKPTASARRAEVVELVDTQR